MQTKEEYKLKPKEKINPTQLQILKGPEFRHSDLLHLPQREAGTSGLIASYFQQYTKQRLRILTGAQYDNSTETSLCHQLAPTARVKLGEIQAKLG